MFAQLEPFLSIGGGHKTTIVAGGGDRGGRGAQCTGRWSESGPCRHCRQPQQPDTLRRREEMVFVRISVFVMIYNWMKERGGEWRGRRWKDGIGEGTVI